MLIMSTMGSSAITPKLCTRTGLTSWVCDLCSQAGHSDEPYPLDSPAVTVLKSLRISNKGPGIFTSHWVPQMMELILYMDQKRI